MRAMKMAGLVILLAAGVAVAANQVTYTVLIGGNNNAANLRNGILTPYSGGSDVDGQNVTSDVLDWAVKVDVSGTPLPKGVANIVFDLELQQWNGSAWVPVAIDRATLDASGNPTGAGFFSSVLNGTSSYAPFARTENAAFAISLDANEDMTVSGMLINDYANDGPNMDYYWHPSTADFKGGSATMPGSAGTTTAPLGSLIGFGAGYKVIELPLDADALGVGVTLGQDLGNGCYNGLGNGPLFEGQIAFGPVVGGLPNGNYKLVVRPSADGTNVVRPSVDCNGQSYGAGSFAVKADAVNDAPGDNAAELTFVLNRTQPTQVVGRYVFYNQSYYDGNKVAIDPAPISGANNDDDDAIDTSKVALRPGMGLAGTAQYTGYDKGINGIMIDIDDAPRAPVVSDFTFINKGRNGTANIAVNPVAFLARPKPGGDGNDYRCVFTFANGSLKRVWLECRTKTTIGLAAEDVFWFGNAPGDTLNPTGSNVLVDASDVAAVRTNYNSPVNRAKVWNAYDVNKSSLIDASDVSAVRAHYDSPANCLVRITR